MFRLILFDIARALRPRAATSARDHAAALERLPSCLRADMGLSGGMGATRSLERAQDQLAENGRRDADRLLAILSELAAARGFGPLEWEQGDD